jgi:hypothetical protein
MEQQISLITFTKDFLWKNFWHIDGVAWLIIGLFIFFTVYFIISIKDRKLSTPSKFAPSVMTAAGLLGTFIGLTYGLKDLNLQEQTSMQALIDGLKLVFVYSLVGVFSAILFMLLNMIPAAIQNRENKIRSDQSKLDAQTHNQNLLNVLKTSLTEQEKMAFAIAKLQFDKALLHKGLKG